MSKHGSDPEPDPVRIEINCRIRISNDGLKGPSG
jgi:hypothetical protein